MMALWVTFKREAVVSQSGKPRERAERGAADSHHLVVHGVEDRDDPALAMASPLCFCLFPPSTIHRFLSENEGAPIESFHHATEHDGEQCDGLVFDQGQVEAPLHRDMRSEPAHIVSARKSVMAIILGILVGPHAIGDTILVQRDEDDDENEPNPVWGDVGAHQACDGDMHFWVRNIVSRSGMFRS